MKKIYLTFIVAFISLKIVAQKNPEKELGVSINTNHFKKK